MKKILIIKEQIDSGYKQARSKLIQQTRIKGPERFRFTLITHKSQLQTGTRPMRQAGRLSSPWSSIAFSLENGAREIGAEVTPNIDRTSTGGKSHRLENLDRLAVHEFG